jgi:hypothetical protein
MELHFISTGKFGYQHMLSVESAIQTQKVDKIYLWCTVDPAGKFYDAIKDKIETKFVEMKGGKALQGKDEKFIATHTKDAIEWEILEQFGGICLDLDVICIKDLTELMQSKHDRIIASLDVEDEKSIAFPFNNAIVICKKGSRTIKIINEFVTEKIEQNISWGDTGPIILSIVMKATGNDVFSRDTAPHKVLCPWGGNEIGIVYEERINIELPQETRAIHLYAKASGEKFDNINAKWARESNSLLARTIRQIVPIEIREIEEDYNVEEYLRRRGKHYRGLFDVVEKNDIKTILEIGTSRGETALGLITVAGKRVGEENVHYYGLDLFEYATKEKLEEEFSGNYGGAIQEEVWKMLEESTKAKIELNTAVKEFVDLIYIDGGHSLKTVEKDWNLAKQLMHDDSIAVFDDYFSEIPFIGAKHTVDKIDKTKYNVEIRQEVDDYGAQWGRLRTQLAIVTRKKENEKEIRKYKNEWAKKVMKRIE